MQLIADLPFVAGHVALDFVNTAEGRGGPGAGDALNTPVDLAAWGHRYGILKDVGLGMDAAGDADGTGRANGAAIADIAVIADIAGAVAELARARDARELLYSIFVSRITGQELAGEHLDRLAGLAAEAYGASTLQSAGDGNIHWIWSPGELATVRHLAVTSAVDLLRAVPGGRLKQCPGDDCGWLFLDTTKRGNRRWCSMSECGQDAKDERRRARRQATDPDPDPDLACSCLPFAIAASSIDDSMASPAVEAASLAPPKTDQLYAQVGLYA